ncbi:hypothetical protein PCANC_25799 [Puccinia coronata f. sp. avenae]|uniref:SUN domain-containing protein n=1 Tax=Puccinia coronata f. sp. avenae TaxID=200324 RepID=A0A2N5S3M1_9BASI|nr:hypothetical protein PCANC_25799 [Puccinia coronata f. sp. avenae]
MTTRDSIRLRHSTGNTSNHAAIIPSSRGTSFGRTAAIQWKSNRGFILMIILGALILFKIRQDQLLIDKKLFIIEERLQEIHNLTKLVNQFGSSVVKKDEFDQKIVQLEKHWKKALDSRIPTNNSLKKADVDSISFSRRDFASFSGGASIIDQFTSPTWSVNHKSQSKKLPFYRGHVKVTGSSPDTILMSDLSVGTCWPFHGMTGTVAIQLSRTIWVDGITIGHVSNALAYDIRTAPKVFELWGLDPTKEDEEGSLLLRSTYRIDSTRNIQEFSVPQDKSKLLSQVLLKIKSNHGNPNVTCVYRVQIHGRAENNVGGNDLNNFTPT